MALNDLGKKPNILIIITDQEREVMHWPAGWAEANLHRRIGHRVAMHVTQIQFQPQPSHGSLLRLARNSRPPASQTLAGRGKHTGSPTRG